MEQFAAGKKENEQTVDQVPSSKELETEVRISCRPRSMTMLKLEWVAERVRKVERIRKQVEAGTYRVDSALVAKALLGIE